MELSLASVWSCSVEPHPFLVGNASSFPFIKCRSLQFRILVQKCAVNPEIPIKKIGGSGVRRVGTSRFEDGAAPSPARAKHSLSPDSCLNCSENSWGLEVTAGAVCRRKTVGATTVKVVLASTNNLFAWQGQIGRSLSGVTKGKLISKSLLCSNSQAVHGQRR